MAEGPSKQNIAAIFKRLRSIPTNKQCFDCGASNPTWASVTYGVFLCIDCSAVHRSLGVHVTFIRSTQLDTSWTWLQLRAMQVGGNAAATGYFRQHGCTSTDAQQKYHSRAATLYREKLHGLAVKALHQYGTKLHFHDTKGQLNIDSHGDEVNSPTDKDVDFFKQHEEETTPSDWSAAVPTTQPQSIPVSNGTVTKEQQLFDGGEGPNVEAALSTSPTEALRTAEPRKPTIGARKPAGPKKGGLGAKKGLGGQKVKANFNDIENEAIQKDKDRAQLAENLALQEAKTKEEEEKKMASMRLAYQDLSVQEKKQNEKLRNMDPKKAQQAERLGMGFGGSRGVSHSVMTDMKVIEQEKPRSERDRYTSRDRDFDDFEFVGFSSGPPKKDKDHTDDKDESYSDSPFGVRKEDSWGVDDRLGSLGSKNGGRSSDKSSTIEDIPMHKPEDDRGRSRRFEAAADGGEAQKKFGSAKAISSDQYFGPRDPDLETKQNLSKFDGKSSISSSELFGGGGPAPTTRSHYGGAGPDLQEIKDGVRQGVTKVAGKISSLTTGIISSIQDNYG